MEAKLLGGTEFDYLVDFGSRAGPWEYDFWMTDGEYPVSIRMATFS